MGGIRLLEVHEFNGKFIIIHNDRYLKSWKPHCRSNRTTWTTYIDYAKGFSEEEAINILKKLSAEI